MPMVPIVNNGGRWHHVASDHEIERAMKDKRASVYEIPMLCVTYMCSLSTLTFVRCGGTLGGDTRDVECGWVYPHDIAFRLDEFEIRHLAEHPANSAFGG